MKWDLLKPGGLEMMFIDLSRSPSQPKGLEMMYIDLSRSPS